MSAFDVPARRNTFILPGQGVRLHGVHSRAECHGPHCTLHNPSDHSMRGWDMVWRYDRRIIERLCEHGVGHPDPDTPMHVDTVHGCDGCCIEYMPKVMDVYSLHDGKAYSDRGYWVMSSVTWGRFVRCFKSSSTWTAPALTLLGLDVVIRNGVAGIRLEPWF